MACMAKLVFFSDAFGFFLFGSFFFLISNKYFHFDQISLKKIFFGNNTVPSVKQTVLRE